MSYLLTQISLYMIATFLFGLLLGWLIWRFGKATDGPREDTSKLHAEIRSLKKERDDLQANLKAQEDAGASLREENTTLKTKLDQCEMRVDDLQSMLATEMPAAVPAEEAAPADAIASTKPQGIDGPRGGVADELQRISGVGPKLEQLLHDLGFYHFDQIAAWTENEVAWVDQNLEGFYGRVTRDEWIKQAKELARG